MHEQAYLLYLLLYWPTFPHWPTIIIVTPPSVLCFSLSPSPPLFPPPPPLYFIYSSSSFSIPPLHLSVFLTMMLNLHSWTAVIRRRRRNTSTSIARSVLPLLHPHRHPPALLSLCLLPLLKKRKQRRTRRRTRALRGREILSSVAIAQTNPWGRRHRRLEDRYLMWRMSVRQVLAQVQVQVPYGVTMAILDPVTTRLWTLNDGGV